MAQLAAQVTAQDGAVAVALPAQNVELPGYVTTTVTLTAPFEGVTLWQPDHPALYTLQTTLAPPAFQVDIAARIKKC